MKQFKLAVIILVFSICSNASEFSLKAKKWELYKKINSISAELDSNEHSKDQVDNAILYLDKVLNALEETSPRQPVQLSLLSPVNDISSDKTPKIRVSGGLSPGDEVRLYGDSHCTSVLAVSYTHLTLPTICSV